MYEEHFQDINQVIAWEKQSKGWSRKKKEALFKADVSEIQRLARSYNNNSEKKHPSSGQAIIQAPP